MRYALDNSEVMIHQPMGGISGQAVDMEIEARRILRIRELINQILARHTGQPIEVIERETERDRYFSAQEAKEFGLVDDVLLKLTEEKPAKK